MWEHSLAEEVWLKQVNTGAGARVGKCASWTVTHAAPHTLWRPEIGETVVRVQLR